jgi:hypothetical protein
MTTTNTSRDQARVTRASTYAASEETITITSTLTTVTRVLFRSAWPSPASSQAVR